MHKLKSISIVHSLESYQMYFLHIRKSYNNFSRAIILFHTPKLVILATKDKKPYPDVEESRLEISKDTCIDIERHIVMVGLDPIWKQNVQLLRI